jgi:hypothetical protein
MMSGTWRRWFTVLMIISGCIGLSGCGGDDDGNEEVIGDSPEGIEVDTTTGDDQDNTGQATIGEDDDTTTDGQ